MPISFYSCRDFCTGYSFLQVVRRQKNIFGISDAGFHRCRLPPGNSRLWLWLRKQLFRGYRQRLWGMHTWLYKRLPGQWPATGSWRVCSNARKTGIGIGCLINLSTNCCCSNRWSGSSAAGSYTSALPRQNRTETPGPHVWPKDPLFALQAERSVITLFDSQCLWKGGSKR